MYLVVGLGNPGKEYDMTRHNMGFMCIDAIARQYNAEINQSKFCGLYTQIIKNGEKVILLKPQKYINLSGEVIIQFLNYFKIPIENLLIICDDLDTYFGNIKIKSKGSSGGHNGLKNIEQNIKTQCYKRIKLGISNDKSIDTKNYVLSKIPKSDEPVLNQTIDTVINIFDDYFQLSFEQLMTKYNHKQ